MCPSLIRVKISIMKRLLFDEKNGGTDGYESGENMSIIKHINKENAKWNIC